MPEHVTVTFCDVAPVATFGTTAVPFVPLAIVIAIPVVAPIFAVHPETSPLAAVIVSTFASEPASPGLDKTTGGSALTIVGPTPPLLDPPELDPLDEPPELEPPPELDEDDELEDDEPPELDDT